MKFVSEKIIDAVIDEFENLNETETEQRLAEFAEAEPVLVAYLFHPENFHLLTDDERGYLEYLAYIIWASNRKVNGAEEAVGEEEIGMAEEKNFERLEASTAKKFRERLTPFFENYPQEDLLAFAEEAVLEEENEEEPLVSREGREPIFIALKTVIDVLATDLPA